MALNPSEEQIRLFVEMAPGISCNEIIMRIKGNNNDVEQALNEYYDNPNTTKYLMDNFTSDIEQESGSMNNQGISYRIHADDIPQSFNQYNTAQSRPPSRIGNRFPVSKTMYSPTETTTANDLNIQEQDADLKKALALSAQEAGMISQDMDVSSKSISNFGPATRELYDSNQWSIVPLGKSSPAEFNSDPDPSDREREPGAPAFLKPCAQNHNLGALITIYHEIPMMRNNFLNANDVLENYGYDKLWWTGKPIDSGRLHADENVFLDFNRELQRIMAFLDYTERSYGSVETLASAPELTASSRALDGSDKDCAFLEAWRQLVEEKYPEMVDQVFGSGVASEETENDEKKFAILELSLPNHSFYENLYDICDECLWPDLQPLDIAASPYLSHIAEVVTFKIKATNEQKTIKFPEVWYPDRYLKQSRQATLDMRKKKFDTLEEIDKINKLEERLTIVTSINTSFFTVKKMFEMSLRHNEASLPDDGIQISQEHEDMIKSNDVMPTNLNTELRNLVESIDKKIDDLNRKKDILRADLRELSNLYTHQSSLPEAPKLTPYSLRGLCTNRNTIYVCQLINASEDLSLLHEPKLPINQWWRIQYSTDNTPIVALNRTTIEQVLIAASEESRNPILVYASEKALSVPKIPLPKPLQTFVQWDNRLFNTELQEERAKQNTGSLKTDSFSRIRHQSPLASGNPVKRKFVYGDSDDTRVESGRFEGESSVDSASPELSHQYFDGTTLNLGGNVEREQEAQNLIVGIDPSLIEGCNSSIENESLPSKRETVDKMDFVFEKKEKEINQG
ncbi:putative ubiquitin interaction domain-containing protein [Golovinomyces cichoracearum]|uniref:Putative ubiquitin interaction domain-containing protein n=1 Tax=Golovinomyces cichoracearum TaxID=62708 RepID=A0A420HLU4_9PEZI|nr:putative ubiquitin interaction domain-containing protein [Golovinomyces cichoracearum]